MRDLIRRIRVLVKQTDDTSILPIKYAIPLGICAFIALWALPEDRVESVNMTEQVVIESSTTLYPINPIAIQDLSADMHHTEEWIPPVPKTRDAVKQIPTTTTTTITTTTTTVAPTTTVARPQTALVVSSGEARCPQWWDLALEVGWTEQDLPRIDVIMWAESRCQPDAISPTKDYGLMQVNRAVWQDYVEARGYVMDDLLDPAIGLMFGLFVAQEAESYGWCRYQPWYMSGDWC